ncbi:NAD(P)H-hydrate dehydratase [Candidatus Margulisiibacteriota bacterium]
MIKIDIVKLLPKRNKNTHKSQCGRVGIIAGSKNMLGAAVLCARSALRSGAGLVYLFTVKEATPLVNIVYPEIIVLPFQDYLKVKLDVIAIGPGMGREKSTQKFINKVLKDIQIPAVVDADALYSVDFTKLRNKDLVLTPHQGEYDRRFSQKCEQTAKEINQIVVLKGPKTQVCSPTEKYVNTTGNPGMATAGSGDVLTGIIAALIGQGLISFNAAKLGVYLHGLAGDLAKKEKGIYSLIASDIIDNLGTAFSIIK